MHFLQTTSPCFHSESGMDNIISLPLPCVSAILRICNNFIVLSTGYMIFIYTFKMELKHKLHIKLNPISTMKDLIIGINKQHEIICIRIKDVIKLWTVQNPHKFKICRIFTGRQFATLDVKNNLFLHSEQISKKISIIDTVLDVKIINNDILVLTRKCLRYLNKSVYFDFEIDCGHICFHDKSIYVVVNGNSVVEYSITDLLYCNKFSFNQTVLATHSVAKDVLLFITNYMFLFLRNDRLTAQNHSLLICPKSVNNKLDFTASIQLNSDYLFIVGPKCLYLWSLPTFYDILNKYILKQDYYKLCESIIDMHNDTLSSCIRTPTYGDTLRHLFNSVINGVLSFLPESNDYDLYYILLKTSAVLGSTLIFSKYAQNNFKFPLFCNSILADLIRGKLISWLPEDLSYALIISSEYRDDLLLLLNPNCLNIHDLLINLNDAKSLAIIYHRILNDYNKAFDCLLSVNHPFLSEYTTFLLNDCDVFNSSTAKFNKSFIMESIPKLHSIKVVFNIITSNDEWYNAVYLFSQSLLNPYQLYDYYTYLLYLPHTCPDKLVIDILSFNSSDICGNANVKCNNAFITYFYFNKNCSINNNYFYYFMRTCDYKKAAEYANLITFPECDSRKSEFNYWTPWYDLLFGLLFELVQNKISMPIYSLINILYSIDAKRTVKLIIQNIKINENLIVDGANHEIYSDILDELIVEGSNNIQRYARIYYHSILTANELMLPNVMLKLQIPLDLSCNMIKDHTTHLLVVIINLTINKEYESAILTIIQNIDKLGAQAGIHYGLQHYHCINNIEEYMGILLIRHDEINFAVNCEIFSTSIISKSSLVNTLIDIGDMNKVLFSIYKNTGSIGKELLKHIDNKPEVGSIERIMVLDYLEGMKTVKKTGIRGDCCFICKTPDRNIIIFQNWVVCHQCVGFVYYKHHGTINRNMMINYNTKNCSVDAECSVILNNMIFKPSIKVNLETESIVSTNVLSMAVTSREEMITISELRRILE
eukprot:NODE_312_length_11237_cov_0.283624.p1 type:complete len:993 gc:universal NODE_312_length_11237_cov_0.283624:6624-9602(+)